MPEGLIPQGRCEQTGVYVPQREALIRAPIALSSRIMFEKIKVQLPAAEEKVAHLRRFL
jgi:hypothetical protein